MIFGASAYASEPFEAPPDEGGPALMPPPASRNVLLLSPRDSDRATLSASSAVPTLPATNTQNVQPRRVWRSLGTSEWLLWRMVEPLDCDTAGIVFSTFHDGVLVRVTGAADVPSLDSAPVVDTGWVSPWATGARPTAPDWPSFTNVLSFANDVPLQYWRLEMVDDSGLLDHIDIGRVMIGRRWQPSLNIDFGGTPVGHDPRDAIGETDYGSTFTDRRTKSPPRLFDLQISAANSIEVLRGLQEIQRLAGLAGDVICCIDPGATDDFHLLTMQGRFMAGAKYGTAPYYDADGYCWSGSISLREFL